jgi:hypothetical protein
MKIALIALAGLAAAFIFVPTTQETTDWQGILYQENKNPPKSGLQRAIEGRLRWLGVL